MAPAPILGFCSCWGLPGVCTPTVLQLLEWAQGPGKRGGGGRKYTGVQAELQGHFLSSLCYSLCSLGASDFPFLSFALDAILSQIGVLCAQSRGGVRRCRGEKRGSLAKLQTAVTAICQVLCDCQALGMYCLKSS